MHVQIHIVAFWGIETIDVAIQIHIANGLSGDAITGVRRMFAFNCIPCKGGDINA